MTARKNYHHGDLEKALVAEGLAQVRLRGGEAVSLRQVAQAVGVSPSAAYAHFPDKLALMSAVGSAGMELLDERVLASGHGIDTGDAQRDAVARFRAVGLAYVGFAVDEPHLFRHMFGPMCMHAEKDVDGLPTESVSYRALCDTLDDLDDLGLLRPDTREGLDIAAWTMVHGFSSLVLDSFLPVEVGEVLLDVLGRLALSDEARAHLLATRATSTGEGQST